MADTYYTDRETLEKLRGINRALFGDGTHLTPDRRRDLANLMYVLLDDSHFWPMLVHKHGPNCPCTNCT